MKRKIKLQVIDISLIALMVSIITICSWITIPSTIPFTLQTFAIFLSLGLLGGRRGTVCILIYLLLGLVGVPVFSNFKSGIVALGGPTGGYIIGFLLMGIFYWLMESIFKRNENIAFIIGCLGGLLLCYTFGTIWFMMVYNMN
ncbi:MAG: biotin transporter BioY [Bacilli bacterium]|nr:biotin transporter BioY [Bacilli bacterium]